MSVTRVPLINKQLEEIRDAILHTGAVMPTPRSWTKCSR